MLRPVHVCIGNAIVRGGRSDMDIATEEFSHLGVLGATIQMLLAGVNGELQDAVTSKENGWMKVLGGRAEKEQVINEAMVNPQFLVLSGGGPRVTNSQDAPCLGSYVDANG